METRAMLYSLGQITPKNENNRNERDKHKNNIKIQTRKTKTVNKKQQ